MATVGKVQSVWRYPVKSMRGEAPDAVFAGFAGVYGDRICAIKSSTSERGFPYLTGREHRELLLYQPRFRQSESAALPPNLREAEDLEPGLSSVYAELDDLGLEVVTPTGEVLPIDDPMFIEQLGKNLGGEAHLSLLRSHRSMTDCRPLSLISTQSVDALAQACGTSVDKRQFRANVYLDLESNSGFAEDDFVGKTLGIGEKVVVSILERDPRCAMITLDPETAKAHPAVLRHVTRNRSGMAGVYAAVLVEGLIHAGDRVSVLS